MVKKLLLSLVLLLVLSSAQAQELNCNVIVNSQAITSIDKRVFEQFKKAIQDFMNLRRWTNDVYTNDERINCNLVITLTNSPTITSFEGTAQIQSSRPIYGTGYEAVILNYLDKDFNFEYTEGQPFDFNENSYQNNLISLLSYYAFVIIGYDSDTYSKLGGKPYYNKALVIATNATSSNQKGWQAFEGTTTRYWLIENLTSALVLPFRESVYTYHRIGLDQFIQKPEEARKITLEMLKKIQIVVQQKPLSVLINNFFDAKSSEIINMLKEASPSDKQAAYNILAQVDPTKTDQYAALIK